MDNKIRFRAQSKPWHSGISLAAFNETHHVELLTLEPHKDGELITEFATLDWPQAQLLMDDLWNCGVRPTEGAGSAGALAAVQAHLADMRKLVFADKT